MNDKIDNFDKEVDAILNSVKTMLICKHHDYGEDNLRKHGLLGIIVRLDDKLARLTSLQRSDPLVTTEKMEDTFKDIIGYSVQAIRMLNKKGA